MIVLTALAFSMAASGPSNASSLTKVAEWYAAAYGTTGPALLIGAQPAAASSGQTTSVVNPAGTAAAPGGSTAGPVTSPAVGTPPGDATASGIWSGYSADYGLNAEEQELFGLINQERTANGLAAYTINLKLSYLARLRAQNMANNDNLTHYSPTYGAPPQMEQAAGIWENPMGAENICEGPSVSADNTALFNSPDHRANLLDPRETQIGLGVVRGSDGTVWVSELFLGS